MLPYTYSHLPQLTILNQSPELLFNPSGHGSASDQHPEFHVHGEYLLMAIFPLTEYARFLAGL